MTKRELFDEYARIGHALSCGARIELLDLLFQAERTVEALAAETGLSVANASQHLQVLRRAQMVKVRRAGLYAFYSLASDEVYLLWSSLRAFGEKRVAGVQGALSQFLSTRENLEEVSAEELQRRLYEGEVTVIDVRPQAEFEACHVAGAISMPIEEIAHRLDALPRDREIVAYCRGPFCVQSDAAVSVLRRHGFTARRLEFGLPEWRAKGHLVSTSKA